jgi:hypothetical protein
LRWLILYDTLAFSIVALLTLACAFYFRSPEDNDIFSIASDWKFKADLYWLRNLYALTAIPFVPFILPGLFIEKRKLILKGVFIFLTHAKATGYSRYGKTMPKVVYKSKYTRFLFFV